MPSTTRTERTEQASVYEGIGDEEDAYSTKPLLLNSQCSHHGYHHHHFRILHFLGRVGIMLAAMLLTAALLFLSGIHSLSSNELAGVMFGNSNGGEENMPSPLQFHNDTFRIVVFSDLHYGERDGDNNWVQWGVWQDGNSTRVMEDALSDETPHFVVFGGDQITGENQLENATLFLDQVFGPVSKHNVPFACGYGNHDESWNISHVSSFNYEKTHFPDLSRTQLTPGTSADAEGVFNYFLPVYVPGGTVPVLLLWFFDSRAAVYSPEEEHKVRDWVDPLAASWLNATEAEIRRNWGSLPKSIAFVHIPPARTQAIGDAAADKKGIDIDEPFGVQGEGAESWGVTDPDEPFWQAIAGLGADLIALNSGHDHGNDWCSRDKDYGVNFCFNRHTGYGGYGGWARGSRVFEAKVKDGELDSVGAWVRMEDHSVANATILLKDGKVVLEY